ncbi:MAG: excinuclease ABC subunit UvrA [Paludibacteraceae bacterium]|nr:excinuclease ABC subunit UvrA [Paludibacteraceae bacterium]
MSTEDFIQVKGAQVNNLKQVDVDIPRGSLTVITGLSGSGKSSLAFDTLYAEGQRRYVESLSSYARQFLGRMSKPEVDAIVGLPPAIAVEQKVKTRNSRSTVGTSTEIYDYLRKLFARIGKTVSPISGREVKKHQVADVQQMIGALDEGTPVLLTAPVALVPQRLEELRQQGFSRFWAAGALVRIDELQQHLENYPDALLVVDRVAVEPGPAFLNRLADSVQTAFYEGGGVCRVLVLDGQRNVVRTEEFSEAFSADGIQFMQPSEQLLSFNSPLGACPECEGFGQIIGIDEHAVIPNPALSVFEGAVAPWRGEKMGEYRKAVVRGAAQCGFPVHEPYYRLTDAQKRQLWEGTPYFEGINAFFEWVKSNQYKIQYRVMLSRYRGKTKCPACDGSRLRPEALYVRVGGKNIHELTAMSVGDLLHFFNTLTLNDYEREAAKKLLIEITNRLQYLLDVGLGYLTLDRAANTLSGGESQRINLSTSLGSSPVGSLYVLDEPSVGLHSRDTQRLIGVLRKLQALGNTVVVVEHDEQMMRASDWMVDMGPGAGRLGGEVTAVGRPAQLLSEADRYPKSPSLRFLSGEDRMPVPASRRKANQFLEITEATEHNLKNLNVKFPLGVISVVTGVSGSGKSTLVRDVLYAALKRHFDEAVDYVGSFGSLQGALHLVEGVEFVDQNPIGKSTRSNPATYLKAFDEIRRLFADQPLAKQSGYTAGYFSFNSVGGRCEECQGEGVVTVPMQFMADVVLTCEACHGRRYKPDTLDVKYRGVSIYDVLEMTVNQAVEFFSEDEKASRVTTRLKPLQEVGLGYLKLGQSSSTLSGGENQRVKLASFLTGDDRLHRLFIFDEPTTGLHYYDIKTLMHAFDRLIERGNTVVIIEHNLDVIAVADYVLELGPEGGEKGGNLIYEGTPEGLCRCVQSPTAPFLRGKLM